MEQVVFWVMTGWLVVIVVLTLNLLQLAIRLKISRHTDDDQQAPMP